MAEKEVFVMALSEKMTELFDRFIKDCDDAIMMVKEEAESKIENLKLDLDEAITDLKDNLENDIQDLRDDLIAQISAEATPPSSEP